jgi:Oxidoreductase family, NAD-binding Rossmann fold
MPEEVSYVILGRGRWAKRMDGILSGHGRRTSHIAATRSNVGEEDAAYGLRMTTAIAAAGAQVAWLCLPPGPHIPLITKAALIAGLHVIVEKPWLTPPGETARLLELAKGAGRIVAVHYEYCFLREVENWHQQLQGGAGLRFGGRFTVSSPDQVGVPAIENLGSHLLAIREFAAPHAQLAGIHCGYDMPDERRVWLERDGRASSSVNFLGNSEPVIQRFIDRFEDGARRTDFALDLGFASRVAAALAFLKEQQSRNEPN